MTNGLVIEMDLARPQPQLPVFDWIVCLEVAEHIPRQYEAAFLANLHEHNREGMILSWADEITPVHVNTRTNQEVIAILAGLGYIHDAEAEAAARNVTAFWWLKRSLMVFRKATHARHR